MQKELCDLALAINMRAAQIYAFEDGASDLADAKDLARALARILNGETLRSGFGSPGDWGYETPIGEALANVYRQPGAGDLRLYLKAEKAGG